MLILPIDEAKAGMTLAAPVSHPDQPGQELLKFGYVLEDEVIRRMRSLGIMQIFVNYPGLDDLDRHLAVNLSPARQKLYSQVKDTVVASQRNTDPQVSYTDYYATTRELILTLMSQGQHPVYIESMANMGADAVTHATAVAHLSLLLGIKLETYLIQQRKRLPAHHAKEVVNLGVAGMLHDMGKLTLPAELQHYNGVNLPEDPEVLKTWQEHAQKGYDLVRNGVEPSAAAAILHHHQHWDGSGFPETVYRDGTTARPSNTHIHIFARILAVANLYDRLATPLESKHRRPNVEILHLLRTQYSSWCDPTIQNMLQAVCPPFPPGTIVTLSDNTPAVVVQVEQSDPYRPAVKRMTGNENEKRLDLREEGSLTITHVGQTAVAAFMPPAAPSEPTSSAA